MADFKTPNLAGASPEFNEVLSKFDSIKGEVAAGLELDASTLANTLNTSVVEDLKGKLGDLVPEIPELPNVNLQSEMSSLVNIDQNTVAGQLEFATKKAELKTKFGDGLTAGGFDLDTLTTNATAAQAAASTAASNLTSATSALASAKETATSSLDTAFDASLKYDRSNVPNPTKIINDLSASTTSAVSALSSQASATTALADAKGVATRIQDVVPNFELPAAGGVAFEKASAVLQPTVDTVKEDASTVELNKKLEEDIKAKVDELKEFERDTPKVLPTENKGAFAVATKAKEVTITHTPDENADNNSIETTEVREDGATITTTVTTASDGSQTITTTGGGETVIRYNVAPHGFSRRPTHKKERVTQSATKDSPSTIKTETRSWTDANGNSGTVEIDVITLSDKPVKLIGVRGRPSGKSRTKTIRAAGNIAKSLDVFSVDKNGRILIGWADSNGNAPLADGTFANGIWTRRHQYDATGAKPDKITGKKDEFIYKVSYQYNDNYDPTFDGNEERVKDKGSPKQDDKNKIDLILLNKLIDDENKDYGASGVVEAISVKNSETADYRGTLVKQKTGVYKHINGNEYTVVTNVSSGDTVNMDFLFSAMLDDAQGQPNYDELIG